MFLKYFLLLHVVLLFWTFDYHYFTWIFSRAEAIVCTYNCFFLRFDFPPPAHIIYRQMVAVCHTSRCLCQRQVHTHTNAETSLPLTHTTNNVSLSPCHTTPGPTSLCPLSLPLHQHLPPSSLCVCVLIYMSVWCLMCVYWSVSAHTSPSPIWNMAVSARPVYLDSFLQQKTLVAADGRSSTTNISEKHSNGSRGKWRRHLMTFVDCTEDDDVPDHKRLCLLQE